MYFSYKNQNFCVNCDWLQYSVHTKEIDPEIQCPDGYRIELCQGNNIFQYRALVFDDEGRKFLTLLWHPYSKVLVQNLMTVQVANEFLYMPARDGILKSYELVKEIVECTFNAIGRLDICTDFEGSEAVTSFLMHLNSHHYYTQAKSEGSTWWHEDGRGKKVIHCLTWGSQKSEIKVKIYHKSREIGLLSEDGESEKPWISAQWKEIGMNIHNVWRLEFSMQGAGQLRYNKQPIKLEDVANNEWLLNVACELYEHRFITRVNQGKRAGHKNKDERKYIYQFPAAAKGLSWQEPKARDYEIPESIKLLRSLMRQVDSPVIMSAKPTFEQYALMIIQLVENHHLDGYFKKTWESECRDYFDNLWDNVGNGITTRPLPPSRLMD